MNSRDSLLELRGVNKKYDGFELKDLDLSLERGYIMASSVRMEQAKQRLSKV